MHTSLRSMFSRTPSSSLRQAALQSALALWLVFIIALSHFAPDGHNDQRILQVGALLAALFAFAGTRGAGLALVLGRRSIFYCTLAFFALGVASSLNAYSPRHAFLELAMFLLLLVLAMGVAGEIATAAPRRLTLLLKLLAAGCLLYVLQELLIYAAALATRIQPDVSAFTPGFSNHRFLNHAQTVTLPLLVLLCCRAPRGERLSSLWYALSGCWWALLFLTTGRGTMLGLAAGCVLAACLCGRNAFGFCRAMFFTALLGVAIYAVFFALIPVLAGMHPFGTLTEVAERTARDPTSNRWGLWFRALDLIKSHPLLGVGPLHFAHYAIDVRVAAHPHDWVLQIGAEWGLPALLSLSGAIGLGMLGLWKTGRRIPAGDTENHATLTAWIVIGAAILVDGLVSGLIVMPVSQLLIALYIGCAAGWSWQFRHDAAPRAPALPLRVVAACLTAAALIVVLAILRADLASGGTGAPLNAAEQAWYDGSYYHPRIWVNGHF